MAVVRLSLSEGDTERLYFHRDTGSDWFSHLSAEKKVLQKNGLWKWKKIRKRNDWLDTCVYNLALIDPQMLGGLMMVRSRSKQTEHNRNNQSIDSNIKKQSSFLSDVHRRSKGGWIKKY